MKWFAAFGVAQTWCSDQGTHFKNKLITSLNRELHSHHHVTTAYCPQSNGTVDTVCKEVLRATRALLSEFRLKETEWPSVLPLVQSTLNHSKRQSLGNVAPITAFTGQEPDNPLRTFLPASGMNPASIESIRAKRIMRIEQLSEAIDNIHKSVSVRRTRRRDDAIRKHNSKTHIQEVNFEVGDFVMVAKRQKHDGQKLRVIWTGPRRVTRAVSDLVYECEDLVSGDTDDIHANRLKLYSDSTLNISQELLDTIDHNEIHYNILENILDLRFNSETGIYEVQAEWRGFDDEDPTWEPVSVIHEDVPDKLSKFFDTHPDKNLVLKAKGSIIG